MGLDLRVFDTQIQILQLSFQQMNYKILYVNGMAGTLAPAQAPTDWSWSSHKHKVIMSK